MGMKTVCKFRVLEVNSKEHPLLNEKQLEANGGVQKYAQNVKLAAHYDPNKSEDVSFAAATPSGDLNIYVSNPDVVGSFEPGKCYYLHLIPC